MTAGPHIGPGTHRDHPGDLPSLFVKGNGRARLVTDTDRITVRQLKDRDGTALIVHAGPDNFANIPARYAPGGPDQTTLDTGDSGGRIGCAVVR
jgi:Cu-Zn family superoxide dismutase